MKIAIRQRRLHHVMRTVSMDNLERLVGILAEGRLSHAHVLVLVAPIADVDAGEIMAVLGE